MNSDIGHNSGDFSLDTALAGLDLALKEDRAEHGKSRERMIIIARWVVAVDTAAANNEAYADSQIKDRVRLHPADKIMSPQERVAARWMARGGLNRSSVPRNTNEINDLSAESLNSIEQRLHTGKKYEKVHTYGAAQDAVGRECKAEIKAALDGKGPSLDSVRSSYAEVYFKASTVEGWIADEHYKRSEDHRQDQQLKKAAALKREKAKTDPSVLKELLAFHAKELSELRKIAEQQAAEKAAKVLAPKLTADQRRRSADAFARGEADPVEEYHEE